jgi:hypothetical protein
MKEILQVVHPKDLSAFFSRLGVLPELCAGQISCSACNGVLSFQNFLGVTRRDGKLLFACDRKACWSAFCQGPAAVLPSSPPPVPTSPPRLVSPVAAEIPGTEKPELAEMA